MAKRHSNAIKKIAIIGPECTGKTTLAQSLAQHFQTIWIPEYAREYVLNLNQPYNYNDVVHIAQKQKSQICQEYELANRFVFFDTELIITKVWFDIVFKDKPEWIENAIATSGFDMYLLCNTELIWEPDVVRENGGEMREKLFTIYENELKSRNFKYVIINGIGNERFEKAVSYINNL